MRIPPFLLIALALAHPLRGAGASEALVWESFARSSAAYYLFNATAEGRAVFEAVTAQSARRAARELSPLVEGLARPEWRASLRPELEARLARLDARFRAERGASELLTLADQRLLARMAHEELAGLRLAPAGRLEFVPVEMDSLGLSERFMGPAAPANDTEIPAFLRKIWDDGLVPELRRVEAEWASQVVFRADVPWRGAPRGVLIVSTEGLTPPRAQALVDDVMRVLAPSTVSFPAPERGGRLVVRLGSEVYDFRGRMVTAPFAPPTRTLIDPVALLSFPEKNRLAKFIAQNPLAGALEGERWIGGPLLELFEGGQIGGSLGAYLGSAASFARSPLVVVWSPEPASALVTRLLQGPIRIGSK